MERYNRIMAFLDFCLEPGVKDDTIFNWQSCDHFVRERFPESSSFFTPVGLFIPMMGELLADRVMENIMINFKKKEVPVKLMTLSILRQFYESKFLYSVQGQRSSTTQRVYEIGLEVFYIYSKLNVDELFYYWRQGTPEHLYATELDTLAGNVWMWNESTVYSVDSKTLEIKSFIQSPRIINALLFCLNQRFDGKVAMDWIWESVENMNVYFIDTKAVQLKGVTLRDGILIYFLNVEIESSKTRFCHRADLMTLAVHECCHYLCRRFVDDYSFSSPFCYLHIGAKYFDTSSDVRTDSTPENNPLEMGRAIELILFDGVQPDWHKSSEKAAEEFLKQATSFHTECGDGRPEPLIRQSQYSALEFAVRDRPSISSGAEFCIPRFWLH